MLDERLAAGTPVSSRSMDSVQQLADRYDADRAILFPDKRVDRVRRCTPLAIRQQVGVDQDGQGLSGRPASVRIASRSAPKSESTDGAERSKSPNRLAGRRVLRTGPMTATGEPFRTTSVASPAAARLRISEKLRAASVAVILFTAPIVSD
ncbi:MAG: hypothetical protein WDZ37_07705 [Solirubrobacterales bacterium]